MRKVHSIYCLLVISILLTDIPLSAQQPGSDTDGVEMVQLTPDFRFRDGIYLNFDQVRSNSPVPKAKILTSADYNDREFFNTVMENDKIYFYDQLGGRQEIDKNSIWGYARNGILYVRVEDSFSRITYVGSLCHLVADITTYDRRYYNSPYSSYSPYYSNYYNPYYSPYYNSYYGYPYGPTTVAKKELVQYVIDFETGDRMEYDIKNVEILLMKDPDLYQEFVALSQKKKKQMLFLYLRKYNEKHPIYLPNN